MNENPYASPAEITEKSGEEEKTTRGLRRLAWGLAWILWGCVLLMLLDSFLLLEINGMSTPVDVEFLFVTVPFGVAAMQLIGMILCCFCPNRLAKRGWLHVIGNAVMMGLAASIPFFVAADGRGPGVPGNVFLIGIAVSVVVWQVFLLRVARGLGSTAGIRLTWCAMTVWSLLAAGLIVFVNTESFFPFHAPDDPWKIYENFIRTLLMSAAMVCGGIYAALLVTLRRKIQFVVYSSQFAEG